MGRVPCCEKTGLKKGPWTPEEDQKLLSYIDRHGDGSWHALPAKAGLQRCGKSCRLRWINYLKPDIKRGKFSLQEEETMIQLHALLGNRWSVIAAYLPKRTDNEIKNYWNTHVKKRLSKMGIDHVTHKPKSGGGATSGWGLSHKTQWETARLEAEARLVRQSKLQLATTSSYKSQPHDSSYDLMSTPRTVVAPWQALSEANNNINYMMNDAMLEGGASMFQNPSEHVLVDHHHHDQYHEKDVLSSICSDEYGGNFEDNNVVTGSWDDNIMSMVDASAFPFEDGRFLL